MIASAGRPLKSVVQHRVVECSRLSSAPSIPQTRLIRTVREQGRVATDLACGKRVFVGSAEARPTEAFALAPLF